MDELSTKPSLLTKSYRISKGILYYLPWLQILARLVWTNLGLIYSLG